MVFVISCLVLMLVIVVWGISVQNALVSKEEICSNALSQIGVQQDSRWNAITMVAQQVRDFSEYEYTTLMGALEKRRNSSTAEDISSQDVLSKSVLSRLLAVAEAYPDIKAGENYKQLISITDNYENKVRLSRMVYNDTVTIMNSIVRKFPGSLVSNMLGFRVKEYLNSDKEELPYIKQEGGRA